MSEFDSAVSLVLLNEGGYSDNPKDPGGPTNFGISLNFLKICGLKYDFNRDGIVDQKEIKDLTVENAKYIYHREFWLNAPYQKIINQQLCNYIFDMSVNHGKPTDIKLVQRAIWAINKKYNIIKDDGILGARTLDEINYNGITLLPILMAERAGFYRKIVALKPELKGFLNGFLERAYRI